MMNSICPETRLASEATATKRWRSCISSPVVRFIFEERQHCEWIEGIGCWHRLPEDTLY